MNIDDVHPLVRTWYRLVLDGKKKFSEAPEKGPKIFNEIPVKSTLKELLIAYDYANLIDEDDSTKENEKN